MSGHGNSVGEKRFPTDQRLNHCSISIDGFDANDRRRSFPDKILLMFDWKLMSNRPRDQSVGVPTRCDDLNLRRPGNIPLLTDSRRFPIELQLEDYRIDD